MEILAYLRISSSTQNLDRQREIIAAFSPARVFEDTITGKSRNRPALSELITYSRAGDRLIVPSIDRLGRSLVDLNDILNELIGKQVTVYFVKENLEFGFDESDPVKSLMFNMLSSFAQFERELIKDRQREGIAIAREQGKYKGRQPDKDKQDKIITLYKQGLNKNQIAKTGIATPPTIRKVIEKYKSNTKKSEDF